MESRIHHRGTEYTEITQRISNLKSEISNLKSQISNTLFFSVIPQCSLCLCGESNSLYSQLKFPLALLILICSLQRIRRFPLEKFDDFSNASFLPTLRPIRQSAAAYGNNAAATSGASRPDAAATSAA